jgi:hypothetical protein
VIGLKWLISSIKGRIVREEPKFDSWVEQFLAKLYLPHKRIPDYQGPLPLRPEGLTQKKNIEFCIWKTISWHKFDNHLDGFCNSNTWLIMFNRLLMNITRCCNLLTIHITLLNTMLNIINHNFQVYIWTQIVINDIMYIWKHEKSWYWNIIWMIIMKIVYLWTPRNGS